VAKAALSRLLGSATTPGEAGARVEALACAHLERSGFRVLARNYRCRGGEVDVVARDAEVTVFIEVKGRGGSSHGRGLDAVTRAKRQRLVRAARLYAAAHGIDDRPLRFDVISVDAEPSGAVRIRHDRGAFDVDGR
jgi:putative endonuclease